MIGVNFGIGMRHPTDWACNPHSLFVSICAYTYIFIYLALDIANPWPVPCCAHHWLCSGHADTPTFATPYSKTVTLHVYTVHVNVRTYVRISNSHTWFIHLYVRMYIHVRMYVHRYIQYICMYVLCTHHTYICDWTYMYVRTYDNVLVTCM